MEILTLGSIKRVNTSTSRLKDRQTLESKNTKIIYDIINNFD